MREPPRILLSFMRFFGSELSPDVSRRRRWFALLWGMVVAVLFTILILSAGEHEDDLSTFSDPMMVILGLMVAAHGAAGLLWDDRQSISLWFSVFGSLLYVPLVILVGAFLYAWVGVLRVVAWSSFVFLGVLWGVARCRERG